jgi:DNA-binding PadR family transcriptional regulator
MRRSELLVLLVLAERDAHGYRVMQDIAVMTGGEVTLRPGVLYATLGRLVDDGLIVETDERPAADLDDQRRRYYRVTESGRVALGDEVARLAVLVDHARRIERTWAMP